MATEPQSPTDDEIRKALTDTLHHRGDAAAALGIKRMTLLKRIRGMDKPKKKKKRRLEPPLEGQAIIVMSPLLEQGYRETLKKGMHHEELIRRSQSMILRVAQNLLVEQREECAAAGRDGKPWTPKWLEAEQDRLVNAKFTTNGIEASEE